ncbi:hypothetical protein [Acetivibrio mesophilus]|uniref:Uncharacterized protein n=1 Tax=Acetivibrio mesophilus TaxID=2487273 RepID=A0A4V1K286_9FIRM|nr:hypothetical protein [Acetivibrio mesophilus]ODM27459.1 hypothetical protein A7W90_15195 [Clostridium sp. Bc-iso-3]RXE59419.1 hypothetical protein EFD62_07080 [Acetivibrio mesophilus]HHV30202.1 hypothetical protein [Clostridium sp.]
MEILGAIIYFLMILVPGLVSEWFYNWLSRVRQRTIVASALIFDLLIFIINLIGLRIFNDVYTVEDLFEHFGCLHFTLKYGILSVIVAIILGVISGILAKIFWIRNSKTEG